MSFVVVAADADDEQEHFMKSVREGDHKTVKRMIEEGNIDPAMNDNQPLKTAIEVLRKNQKKVKKLEKDPDIRFGIKELMEPALEVERNNKKTLEALLETRSPTGKRTDPYAVEDMEMDSSTKWLVDREIRMSQEQERISQMRESAKTDKEFNALIQRERDDGNDIAAKFLTAVSEGDQETVWSLLSRTGDLDPAMHDNAAIKKAVANDDTKMVWELMKYKARGVKYSEPSPTNPDMRWELDK